MNTINGFAAALKHNFDTCQWQMDSEYNVATAYDPHYYRDGTKNGPISPGFIRKYRWMYALVRTINPNSMIELGTHAGSSGDAYLSGSRDARGDNTNCVYLGIDVFNNSFHATHEGEWRPLEVAKKLFVKRGFVNYNFLAENFRNIKTLPAADLVVVDGAHDYFNASEDMKLALTANPQWMFIDDMNGADVEKAANELASNLGRSCRLKGCTFLDYPDGGWVIEMIPHALTLNL